MGMRKSVVLLQVGPLALFARWADPLIGLLLAWGWLVVIVLLLFVIWKLYLLIKRIDYVGAIQWTFFQITMPEEADQTPKSMENFYDVLDGMHKNPDLVEKYFDGYLEAWYSLELHCTSGKARYILVVPTAHRRFVEGVVYGQYPRAEINEIEDYTQKYSYDQLHKSLDLYGTEIVLVNDDIYPIKSYMDYADTLSVEDTFVDPMQAMVESYTNITEDEEYWVQMVVRPIDAGDTAAWAARGEEEIDDLAGKEKKKSLGIIGTLFHGLISLPGEAVKAAWDGPLEAPGRSNGGTEFPKVSEADRAKSEGILRKISKGGYRVKIRILYFAPMGKLVKPNISRAIGGFKQYNTFHMNSFKPDPNTKTNGPNYFFKQSRRLRRKREILLNFQWRDFFYYEDGFMLSGEELATIYHFPTQYSRAPSIERAKAGVGGAPDNVPYV